MIEILEKALKNMKASTTHPNTPKKYQKQSAKDFIRLTKDLDRIYKAHSKLKTMEIKIANKYSIDENGEYF